MDYGLCLIYTWRQNWGLYGRLLNTISKHRDGDIEKCDIKEYENHYFINATSKYKPGIVDKKLNEINDEKEIYPGCYVRASINFYYFNKAGQVGIGCGINNIQKLADGEYIHINSRPEDDFSIIEDDLEDLLTWFYP